MGQSVNHYSVSQQASQSDRQSHSYLISPSVVNHSIRQTVMQSVRKSVRRQSVSLNRLAIKSIPAVSASIDSSFLCFPSGVLCIPLVIAAFMLHRWPLGDTLCQIYAVLISLCVNSSIMTLTVISMDRYNALSKPVENRAQLTLTKRHYKLIITASWVHSVFWASGPLFKWGSTKFDEFTHTCKPDWGGEGIVNKTYAIALAIFAFAIPVGAMVYAYFRIYRIARASKRGGAYHLLPAEKSANEETAMTTKHTSTTGLKEDNRALKTVLLLIGSFAACWALYSLATVWKLFAPNSVPPWIVRAGLVLTLCHCCIDPFIYSIRDDKLKREIKAMICGVFSKRET